MANLRMQVVETQKARSDLMKWKLILVATLGAAGLGVRNPPVYHLLCLIPLVCVYVDALCAHLSLRIKLIGQFVVAQQAETEDQHYERAYEEFIRESSPSHQLEFDALYWSTYFVSTLVVVSGPFLSIWRPARDLSFAYWTVLLILLCLSGLGGILATRRIRRWQNEREKVFKRMTDKWRNKRSRGEAQAT